MTSIPTWHERAMAHPDHQSGMVSEDMIRARMCEEIEDLRSEIEKLTRERDEAWAEVERLRDEDTKTRHALRGWVWVCPDGGDEPTHERVSAVVAEVERLTRERDEARAALEPFSDLYLWPDDAGRLIAERVRAREDWDEEANDEESNPYCILRGEIRAARRALEAKP